MISILVVMEHMLLVGNIVQMIEALGYDVELTYVKRGTESGK